MRFFLPSVTIWISKNVDECSAWKGVAQNLWPLLNQQSSEIFWSLLRNLLQTVSRSSSVCADAAIVQVAWTGLSSKLWKRQTLAASSFCVVRTILYNSSEGVLMGLTTWSYMVIHEYHSWPSHAFPNLQSPETLCRAMMRTPWEPRKFGSFGGKFAPSRL